MSFLSYEGTFLISDFGIIDHIKPTETGLSEVFSVRV